MASRRRLRIISSSDEEEDDDRDIQEVQPPNQLQQHDHIDSETLNLENVTLHSLNPNPTNPSDSIQVELSDEDFIDVSDDFSTSPPPPPPPPPSTASAQTGFSSAYSTTSSVGVGEEVGCPISRILGELGLRLRREWLDSCLGGLQTAIPGFSRFDDTKKAKLCFEKFLHSDMNKIGAGVLPENVHQMHLVDLPGPFVLQVDEIVNISQPLRDRYKKAPSGLKRCLKLSMTDGIQRVFGMEYQPIKDLEALAPAGLKVAICNVNVRHGLLMLVPEVFQILGGLVEELDAARQRLVNEVNKPPRGKRTRNGVVPPLATRATLAAWPPDGVRSSAQIDNPMSHGATPLQAEERGDTSAPVNGRVFSNSVDSIHREPAGYHPPRTEVESSISTRRENADFFPPMAAAASSVRGSVETPPLRVRAEASVPINLDNTESFRSPVPVSDDEDTPMASARENPSVLTSSSESPFTYMASLSVKWAASKDKASHVQGRIKCFLTGVKGFQFKQRRTYELQVYIDDGSLISEILVDHNVIQKRIGYSPEEVNAALSSSDPTRVHEMKDTMKQFQVFLVNFEGTMVIRMNEASSFPVAIEMQQGSSLSDAWLLLRRLKSSYTNQTPQHTHLDPITLSP